MSAREHPAGYEAAARAAVASRGDTPHVAPSDPKRLLEDGLIALGVTLDADRVARLLRFVALVDRWNRVYNLTSIRDVRDMLVLHVLDSLAVLPVLGAATIVLDVGSGAGLPAIPLAIACPARTIHSVEAVAKKVAFQREATAALGLANLVPHHARVEALTLGVRPDAIVSRAYASLRAMLDSVAHLVGDATRVVAMKGERPDAELARVSPEWMLAEVRVLDVPFLGAARCAVVFERAGGAAA